MITIIKDATSIGESQGLTIVDGKDTGQDIHSFQISTTGSPTAVTISVLASIDGTDYNCIAKHVMSEKEITNGTALFHIVNKPIPKLKVSIDKLDGGLSPAVSVYYFKGSVSV